MPVDEPYVTLSFRGVVEPTSFCLSQDVGCVAALKVAMMATLGRLPTTGDSAIEGACRIVGPVLGTVAAVSPASHEEFRSPARPVWRRDMCPPRSHVRGLACGVRMMMPGLGAGSPNARRQPAGVGLVKPDRRKGEANRRHALIENGFGGTH